MYSKKNTPIGTTTSYLLFLHTLKRMSYQKLLCNLFALISSLYQLQEGKDLLKVTSNQNKFWFNQSLKTLKSEAD